MLKWEQAKASTYLLGDIPGFSVDYGYDSLGHRVAVTDATGTLQYDYDDLYQPQDIAAPGGAVSYTYDLLGRRETMHYPGGEVVSYTHDAAGHLRSVTDWEGGRSVYTYTAAGRLSEESRSNGMLTQYNYDAAGRLVQETHRDPLDVQVGAYGYTLDALGRHANVTETFTATARVISYTYDMPGRLALADYSTGESFAYQYDALGNRTVMTSTTPLSGTQVTTQTYDAANRLSTRAVSDGRAYTYEWSDRGQMLSEITQGVPVRTFTYNGAGQLVRATVFTLTTEFVYNGLGARVAVSVAGHGVTSYTLDLAQGSRVLAESGVTSTVAYLYGRECLGEERDGEWLHYLSDADGYVRQVADDSGVISSTWLFDPDGTVLEGPSGPVSHLICGGIYDWSTGLIYKGGRYFDPNLGIWLALMPLVVVQGWRGRKKKRGAHPWMLMMCLCLFTMGSLAGCGNKNGINPTPTLCTNGSSGPGWIPEGWRRWLQSPMVSSGDSGTPGATPTGITAWPAIPGFGAGQLPPSTMPEVLTPPTIIPTVTPEQGEVPLSSTGFISPFGANVSYHVGWNFYSDDGDHQALDMVSANDPYYTDILETNGPMFDAPDYHETDESQRKLDTPGREVYAVASGTIQQWYGGFDLFTSVNGVEYEIQYVHIDRGGKPNGVVSQGDFLGYYAKWPDGWSSIPHLHFGVKANGIWIDPFNVLPAR